MLISSARYVGEFVAKKTGTQKEAAEVV